MCKTCFDKEYYSFPTYQDFDAFDLKLTKKLSLGGLKHVSNNGQYLGHSFYTYHCNSCNTTWWLDQPENAWRGFFAHENTAKRIIEELERESKRSEIGCYILIVLFALLIILVTLKCCGK